jgi:hypothetical protein
MGGIEGAARLQPDHQRLRRRQQTASVEEVAQAAAVEVLDHPEVRRLAVELDRPPVEDRRDVGVGDGGRPCRHPAEDAAEVVVGQCRLDHLDRDRLRGALVVGVGDDRVGTGGDDPGDAVAPGEHPSFEAAELPTGSVRRIDVHQAYDAIGCPSAVGCALRAGMMGA